jgi:hypothetical protein
MESSTSLKPFSYYTDRSNYLGHGYPDFLIALEGVGIGYDSNEKELILRFTKANLVEDTDYIITSIGGWAGTCNFLLINKDCQVGVELAETAALEIKDYPLLNEDDYYARENDAKEALWNSMSEADKATMTTEAFGHSILDWLELNQQEESYLVLENLFVE